MHVVIWEFVVRERYASEFGATYSAEGAWAELFRHDPSYLGTEVLVDRGRPLRFLTIDRWASAEAYTRFRSGHARAYAELDRRCEAWTESEVFLGEFADGRATMAAP
jgi:hypothetical protein